MLTLDCIRGLDTISVSQRVDLDQTVLLRKNVGATVSDGRRYLDACLDACVRCICSESEIEILTWMISSFSQRWRVRKKIGVQAIPQVSRLDFN